MVFSMAGGAFFLRFILTSKCTRLQMITVCFAKWTPDPLLDVCFHMNLYLATPLSMIIVARNTVLHHISTINHLAQYFSCGYLFKENI